MLTGQKSLGHKATARKVLQIWILPVVDFREQVNQLEQKLKIRKT